MEIIVTTMENNNFFIKKYNQNTESVKKDVFAIFIIFFKKHLHYIFFANHFFNYTPVC